MKIIKVIFDGKRYKLHECLNTLLMMEQEYGSLNEVPETFEAQLKYFYFLLKGCNKDFDCSFERFVEILPFQKGLLKTLESFTVKK